MKTFDFVLVLVIGLIAILMFGRAFGAELRAIPRHHAMVAPAKQRVITTPAPPAIPTFIERWNGERR